MGARVRVLTDAGVKMFGQIFLPYSSQLEDLRIDYVRTVKPGGAVIAADPSKALVLTPPVTRYAPTFSDVKLKGLVAPQLQVGDAVEFQFTKTIRTPYMPGNFWVMHALSRSSLVKTATIVLDVPAGRKLTFEADPCFHYTVAEKNGRRIYRWQITDLQPLKQTAVPPAPLFATSTLSDWKQVGDWYAKLQSGQTQVTPEIEALAKKLTSGQNTDEQKLDAIYTYVSEKIRYVALEFGIGGFQAHAAATVLGSGYGDCKDKTGLLDTLLEAAGIKAYPALVNVQRDTLVDAVPMPSQFDHVVSVATLGGKAIWMDTTMQTAPPGILAPSVLGKQALLVQPGAVHLIDLPDQEPFAQQFAAHATGSVDSSGKLSLAVRFEVHGISEAFLRQIFGLQDKTQLLKFVEALARFQLPGSTAANPTNSDPENLSSPFQFQYVLTKQDFVDLLRKNEQVLLPHYFIHPEQWGADLSKAKQEAGERAKNGETGGCATHAAKDISLHGPAEYEETLDLSVPADYHVDLPEPIRVDRPFATYTSSYTFENGHIEARRALDIKAVKEPLSQLEAVENLQDLVDGDLSQELTLRRTGSANILSDAGSMTADELETAGIEALQKESDPVLARDLLLKAVSKAPESKTAWNNLGRSYLALADYDEAEKAFRKQAEINAYDSYAYTYLGLAELAQQHYVQAIADFKQQLSVNPLDRYAAQYLGSAYDQKRDWTDAAAAYETAVRLDPGNAMLRAAWGTDLLKEGKIDEGRQQFQQALSLSKAPVVLNNVAYGRAEAGIDLAEAAEEAGSAVDQTIPENVDSLETSPDYAARMKSLGSFLDTLGWVLYKEGRLSEATGPLDAAYQLNPDPDVAKHVAMLNARLNRPDEARRFYSYAVAQVGGTPVYVPPELETYLQAHGGVPAISAERAGELYKQRQDQLSRLVPAHGSPFTWPSGAGTIPAAVVVNVLVDENGRVLDAKLFRGEEPFGGAAMKDAPRLQFPVLAWSTHVLKTVRSVIFLYDPEAPAVSGRVMAFWQMGPASKPTDPSRQEDTDFAITATAAECFMVEGQVAAGAQLLARAISSSKSPSTDYRTLMFFALTMKHAGVFEGAAAMLRQAVAAEPKDAFACRELAETLKIDHSAPSALTAGKAAPVENP